MRVRLISSGFDFQFSSRREVRLAQTIDDMYTFSQIDDHITTLIRHSYHPNMKRAKEILEKVERRGKSQCFSSQ